MVESRRANLTGSEREENSTSAGGRTGHAFGPIHIDPLVAGATVLLGRIRLYRVSRRSGRAGGT